MAIALATMALDEGTAVRGDESAPLRRTTYSIQYHVTISDARFTTARVRWELAGINEIARVRIRLDGDRFFDFAGTGSVEERGSEIVWTPASPYARLEYRVRLRHRRRDGAGFDAYATSKWFIGRAQDLFPRTNVTFRLDVEHHPSSLAEVRFHLPDGWRSYSAMEEIGPSTYRPPASGRRLDRPKGWLAVGELEVTEREIGRTRVVVAKTPVSDLDSRGLLSLYEKTLPVLSDLLGRKPDKILIVSAADPMWRGGLSGESSIFLHGSRPLRTPDETSPPLHELFHVLAPFRPASDGTWVTEGLAEFYSLELQRRTGSLDSAEWTRALQLFERFGKWHSNLAAGGGLSITNNSAPLVMAAIDRALRTKEGADAGLDAAVRDLRNEERVSTASFLRAVNQVSKRDFTPFFQRHVYAGLPPRLPELEAGRTRSRSRRVTDGRKSEHGYR